MSDAFWIALFAGVPPTIAAIVAAIMQIRKVEKVAQAAKEEADVKNVKANEKLDVIHTLVNDRLTNEIKSKELALARVKLLVKEIDALRETIRAEEEKLGQGGQ